MTGFHWIYLVYKTLQILGQRLQHVSISHFCLRLFFPEMHSMYFNIYNGPNLKSTWVNEYISSSTNRLQKSIFYQTINELKKKVMSHKNGDWVTLPYEKTLPDFFFLFFFKLYKSRISFLGIIQLNGIFKNFASVDLSKWIPSEPLAEILSHSYTIWYFIMMLKACFDPVRHHLILEMKRLASYKHTFAFPKST